MERAGDLLERTDRPDEAESLSASRPAADFEDFYRREYRSVVGLMYTMTGAPQVAEDIAHDAFVEAFRRWDRVGQYEKPGAWVRRIAMQRASRWHTRSLAEARALAQGFLDSDEVISGTELSVEHAELWQAVRALPRRQAQVLALYYQAQYSVGEIAETLGLAPGTVRAQLHDARRSLAKKLGADADFPRAD
jgi:RNA polymerase sigma-70 factor (ECF subfamily)